MILSYKELRKRDVVNIADGRSFGKITDLRLEFPKATLKGIVVCERKKSGLFWFLCKNEIFIDESKIIRIGGDVILVDIDRCYADLPQVVEINGKTPKPQKGCKPPPPSPCPPPCPPPTPSPCPPPCPPNYPLPPKDSGLFSGDFEGADFDDF